MTAPSFQAYTDALTSFLSGDARVIGLIGLGSVAMLSHQPDRYSDHDFFVIVKAGTQQHFHDNIKWLPYSGRIVFHYQDTNHGAKAIYDDAHMIEYAVFDLDELKQYGRVNDYIILIDHADLARLVPQLADASPPKAHSINIDDHTLYGHVLHQCQIAIGRWRRGEQLSSRVLLNAALENTLKLLTRHVTPDNPTVLDNLDVFRRFERGYPPLGAELDAAMAKPVDAAARDLLTILSRELADVAAFPKAAFRVMAAYAAEI